MAAIQSNSESLDLERCFGPGRHFVMTVTSTAGLAAAGVREGDVLVIRRGDRWQSGDLIACVIDAQPGLAVEPVCRWAHRQTDGQRAQVRLEKTGPNGRTVERVVDADRLRVLGVVRGMIRLM